MAVMTASHTLTSSRARQARMASSDSRVERGLVVDMIKDWVCRYLTGE